MTLVAPLGGDAAADKVRDVARMEGLATRFAARPGATPVQHISHSEDGERIFVRYDEGVLGAYRIGASERQLIAGSNVVITTAFGKGLAMFESVIETPSHGLRVVDFTNLNDVGDPLAFAERYAERLHVGLFGLTRDDAALIDGLEEIARQSDRLFVVTLGPDGSLALGGPERIRCLAAPVEQVTDTTGAGDTFTAAFVCAFERDRDIARSLAAGSAAAAETVQHLGAFELAPH